MTFQPGNKLAVGGRKEKPFRDALIMALKEAGDDRPRLRKIAATLLDKAESGDMQAIKEFADRIDGKVPQPQEHSGGENPIEHIHKIERHIVKPVDHPQDQDG